MHELTTIEVATPHDYEALKVLVAERDALKSRVGELERGWDDVLLALGTIRKNALSQIDGMNSMGVPDDASERKAALWYYTEANAALLRR